MLMFDCLFLIISFRLPFKTMFEFNRPEYKNVKYGATYVSSICWSENMIFFVFISYFSEKNPVKKIVGK